MFVVVFKKNVVESALEQKGFQRRNTHHKFYHLHVNGKKVGIFTRMSHGHVEISDFLINRMAKQIGINKNEFIGVIECPITKQKLIELLRNKYNRDI